MRIVRDKNARPIWRRPVIPHNLFSVTRIYIVYLIFLCPQKYLSILDWFCFLDAKNCKKHQIVDKPSVKIFPVYQALSTLGNSLGHLLNSSLL